LIAERRLIAFHFRQAAGNRRLLFVQTGKSTSSIPLPPSANKKTPVPKFGTGVLKKSGVA
jgi:hypothetical protein